jgi:hypothetical protein
MLRSSLCSNALTVDGQHLQVARGRFVRYRPQVAGAAVRQRLLQRGQRPHVAADRAPQPGREQHQQQQLRQQRIQHQLAQRRVARARGLRHRDVEARPGLLVQRDGAQHLAGKGDVAEAEGVGPLDGRRRQARAGPPAPRRRSRAR